MLISSGAILSIIILVMNILFAVTVIFLERRNVVVTWAWLLVLIFLPVVGFVVYIFLGQNLNRRKVYRLANEQISTLHEIVLKQHSELESMTFHDPAAEQHRRLIQMNLVSGHSVYTQDNEVTIYTDGMEKFADLLQKIKDAKHHIHIQYYIFRGDNLGYEIIQALARKAAEGVEVRLLIDHLGSINTPSNFFDDLRGAGGKVEYFFPLKLPTLSLRLNFRNHRKLVIIDGTIGYIGGFNVGDEYLGLSPRFGYWRDTHLRIEGSAVRQMQVQFLMDWHVSQKSKDSDHFNKVEYPYFPETPGRGRAGIQILSSGPNNAEEQIKNAYIRMITSAQRYIYIQTPYFIPDESMYAALRIAAMSGVDVRLMMPGKPDHKFVYWASISYFEHMLEAGVSCYVYKKGFLHAKTLVVDGEVASVGTANMDIRSFRLNFESNAIIYDSTSAAKLARIFLDDLEHCDQLTLEKYKKRPLSLRFRESIARLLSPIL
jgi:cardiolipin synthase